MNHDIALSWKGLLAAYLLLIPAIGIIAYFRLRITRILLISVFRMSIQLFLVGIYLKYLFAWNNFFANFTWILIMLIVAAWTTMKQADLPWKTVLLPILWSTGTGFLSVLFYFVFLIAEKNPSLATLFIPIAGMLLGNSMRCNVVVLQRLTRELRDHRNEYQMRLMLGGTHRESVAPCITAALQSGIAPQIATMATLGIVSLPGMMTGQMLGGSTPTEAIEYQIVIMIGIFAVQLFSAALLAVHVARKP